MTGSELETNAAPRRSSRKHVYAAIAGVVALGGLAWWWSGTAEEGGSPETPAIVRVESARTGPFAVEIKALGTVTPLASVTVRSRVDGELVRVHFREGQQVQKGQLLAEIDPRPYRARLEQALGERRQDQAQLTQAQRELAQHQELAREGFTTKTKLDQQRALVGQFGGAVAAGDGRIADARLQLEFASIRAPITGRIGLRGVDAGNLVSAGDTSEIATITQMQPISVMFTVPEAEIDAVREAMRAGELQVEAWDRGERAKLATGSVATIDNRIDAGSGTVRLRGTFANGDERLFPNQFVNVRLGLRTIANALTVPTTAVQQGTKGPFVYVIDARGMARRREITPGPSDGARTQVQRGIKSGERVVLEGFDRVKDGEPVEIVHASAGVPAKASAPK